MKKFAIIGLALGLVAVCAIALVEPAFAHGVIHHGFASAMFAAPMSATGTVGLTGRGIKRVRAEASNAEIMQLLGDIQRTFASFQTANDDRIQALEGGRGDVLNEEKVNRINAAIDELNVKMAATSLNGGGGRANMTAEQKAHATAFNSYFRKGVEADLKGLEVKAALTEGASPEGGYLTSVEVSTVIDRLLTKVSAMRGLASVISISGSGYKLPVNKGGTATGWTGEAGARVQTTAASLVGVDFEPKELYAEPAITQTLLDDANLDIGQWLADEIALVFAEQEGTSFITGDGAAQPFGLLSYGAVSDNAWKWGKLGFVAIGAGGGFKVDGTGYDDIIDVMGALKQGYRPNASWLMNRKTEASIRKIKDPEGHYLWQPALQAGSLSSVGGYPVAIDDNMQDIAGNAYPLAFGDFKRGYLIVDRIGVRVIRDNLTAKPYVLFYTTKRVGGGVKNFEAIKLGKIVA